MPVIRSDQMKVFEDAAKAKFQDWVLTHLREHFANYCEVLGEQPMRELIRHGCREAEEQGFVTEHEIALFIDLMVMLGSGFATDPQLPWAAEILTKESIASPTERIDKTYEAAMAYIDRVIGKDKVFPMDAWAGAYRWRIPEASEWSSRGRDPILLEQFSQWWPRKAEALGPTLLARLIRHAGQSAQQVRIVSLRGVGVFAGLMFLLGHHFHRDPAMAWAGRALADLAATNEGERVDLLIQEAKANLKRAAIAIQ